MPTNRIWSETHKDRTRFKKFLDEADKELISFGIRSTDAKVLTKQAKKLLTREIHENIRKYRNMFHTKKALKNIKDIVTSSYQARLEALFVEPDQRVWGNFLEDDNRVIVSSEKAPDNEELLNLSLINTLRNGGKVYSLSEIKGFTNGNQPITGILRY